MKLSALIAVYIENRSQTVWTAPTTLRSNKSTLNIIQNEVRERIGYDPEIIEVDDILLWAIVRDKWKEGKSTWPNIIRRIQVFLKWSTSRGYRFGDIDSVIQYKAYTPDLDKKYLNETELKHVLENLMTCENFRDWALVGFQYASHRRAIESCNLRWKDVDFTPRSDAPYGVYWFTETKVGKGRQMLDLLEDEAFYLREWKRYYERETGCEVEPSWYVFPARHGGGRPVKGHAFTRLLPDTPIGDKPYIFRRAYKAAGVWEPGKAGHATRRGGMEEVYQDLDEMGVDNPIEAIAMRTKQSPETVRSYLNKTLAQQRSKRAYTAMAEMRKARKENPSAVQEVTAVGQEVPSNVIDLSSRFRRSAG